MSNREEIVGANPAHITIDAFRVAIATQLAPLIHVPPSDVYPGVIYGKQEQDADFQVVLARFRLKENVQNLAMDVVSKARLPDSSQ